MALALSSTIFQLELEISQETWSLSPVIITSLAESRGKDSRVVKLGNYDANLDQMVEANKI